MSFTTRSAGALVGDFFKECFGLHLRSFVTTTKPQPSLNHNLKSVPLVLTGDTEEERADEAMYQAKAAGRNQFRLTGLETDDNQAERMAENLPHA
jgi:hypothetical protein